MKKFICSVCGTEWYSASDQYKCSKCGGKLVEVEIKSTDKKSN